MSGFVENEALRAKGRDRHQPISAQSLHRGEKTEILYAGNACIYDLSGLFGQVSGDIAINRFAIRLHGPAFISADKFAYAAHVLRVVAPERCRRQDGAVLGLWHFQLVSADQRTMDQKVRDRKSTSLNSRSIMRIPYAGF